MQPITMNFSDTAGRYLMNYKAKFLFSTGTASLCISI